MSQVVIERLDRAVQHDNLLTGKRLAAIEAAYCGSPLTVCEICEQFSISAVELYGLVKLHRWPKRGKGSRGFSNPAALAQEVRIAEQQRHLALYGDALEDVDFLRRCGWAINLTCDGRVKFGNQILTLGELREKAERERRLRQPAPPPIGAARVQAA